MIEQVFPKSGGTAAETVREIGRVRLTRRGRALARVLATVLVVALFLLIAPGLARGVGPDRPAPRVTYVVQPGDTLWSIARRVAPGQDPRPVVDWLIEANDVRSGLQTGQELSIPVPKR